jgi:hypothetical protein
MLCLSCSWAHWQAAGLTFPLPACPGTQCKLKASRPSPLEMASQGAQEVLAGTGSAAAADVTSVLDQDGRARLQFGVAHGLKVINTGHVIQVGSALWPGTCCEQRAWRAFETASRSLHMSAIGLRLAVVAFPGASSALGNHPSRASPSPM